MVVGTVLDPDMQDEVRVTVVATGLNRVSASKTQRPGERAPIKLVRNATTGQPEFGDFDNGGDAVSKAVGGMGMGMGLRRASSDTAAASAPSPRPHRPRRPRRRRNCRTITWTSRPSCAARRTKRAARVVLPGLRHHVLKTRAPGQDGPGRPASRAFQRRAGGSCRWLPLAFQPG